MNINIPLILFLLVALSGAIWLIDSLFFARRRKQRTAVDTQVKDPVAVEYAKSLFPLLAIVFVLRSFLIEPFQIPSSSMVPTLEVGDFIAVNKFAYGIRLPILRQKVIDVGEPQRGDVMVFFPPHDNDTYFIKRVIGLRGDTLRLDNNQLYLNGKAVPQTLIEALPPGNPQVEILWEDIDGHRHLMAKDVIPGPLGSFSTIVVPEGHYFMMGDNRDRSADSRAWGFVPERDIVGKAFAIWMHWEKLFSLPSFGRAGKIE